MTVFFKLFSECDFFEFFRCWVDFLGFWEAKTNAKIDFRDVFFEVFFEHGFGIDFEPIFESSKP